MKDAHVDRSAQRTRHGRAEISRGNKLFSFGHQGQVARKLPPQYPEGVYRKKKKKKRTTTQRDPERKRKKKETPRRENS